MTRDVPCETAERWLSRAIDEEISAEEEVLLERHLDTCPHCRTERERLFLEVQRLESGFAGISAELDDLLRGKLGADRIAEPAPRERVPAAGSLLSTAIAALAAVIVAALLYFDRSPPAAAGPSATAEWNGAGLVLVEGRGASPLAGPGTGLFPAGSRVRVPPGGDLRLVLPAGDRARVGAEGDLEIRAIDGAVELELHAGRAAFGVETRGASSDASSFVVLTPVARIAVTGTRFGVIHEGGSTEVTVEEGIVEVTPRGREAKPRRLGPGGWVSISQKWIRHDSGDWQEPSPIPAGPEAGSPPAEPPAIPEQPDPTPEEGKQRPNPGPLDVPPGGGEKEE